MERCQLELPVIMFNGGGIATGDMDVSRHPNSSQTPVLQFVAVEAQITEAQGMEVEAVEVHSVEALALEAQAVEIQAMEAQAVEEQAVEAQFTKIHTTDAHAAKSQALKSRNMAAKRVEACALKFNATEDLAADTQRLRQPRPAARARQQLILTVENMREYLRALSTLRHWIDDRCYVIDVILRRVEASERLVVTSSSAGMLETRDVNWVYKLVASGLRYWSRCQC